MRILGINLSHDGSACLMEDGEVSVALALERLVRVQRGVIPQVQVPRATADLIDYCLQSCNLRIGDVDWFIGTTTESSSAAEEELMLRDVGYFPREKIISLPHPGHHLAHACAAYYGSGFETAASLVVDAYGSLMGDGRECETAFWCEPHREPEVVFRSQRPSARIAAIGRGGRLRVPRNLYGICEIYRVVSMLLGFRQRGTYYDDAGKTMGLAPYGRRLSQDPQMIRVRDGELNFDNAFEFLQSYNLISDYDGIACLNVKPEDAPFSSFHRDLACQVQWEFEEACLHLVRKSIAATGTDTLVAAGGAFLNSVLNHRILRETDVRKLFVFPAATDDGNSVGAAWYAHQKLTRPTHRRLRHAPAMSMSLGRRYGDDEIRESLESMGCKYERLDHGLGAAQDAGERLSRGEIVGWFQGGSELGPRALGNRSILANPCEPGIKDRLNDTVKFRENFRPFAGAVLQEECHRYFDLEVETSPYMLLVCQVREGVRHLLPGVTHVDGSCRVQTVSREGDPLFHRLIETFGERTQVPVVLNTSFNLRGMPIVETPLDALHCFVSTQMHCLFLGRYAASAPDYRQFVPVLNPVEIKVSRNSPETASPGEDLVVTYVKSPGSTPAHMAITPTQHSLLQHIDGSSSLGALCMRLDIDFAASITQTLAMYRKGLFRWQHIPPPPERARGRAHFALEAA